jgi:hypothetical protein
MRDVNVDRAPLELERVAIPAAIEIAFERDPIVDHDEHIDIRVVALLTASPGPERDDGEEVRAETSGGMPHHRARLVARDQRTHRRRQLARAVLVEREVFRSGRLAESGVKARVEAK